MEDRVVSLLELQTNRCPTEPKTMFNSLFYMDQKLVLRSDWPQSRAELGQKLNISLSSTTGTVSLPQFPLTRLPAGTSHQLSQCP